MAGNKGNALRSELMSNLTLGSLFDGSGGFPLAGILSGIEPIWASEIEPFPIRVTTKRLPFMKHYGDISKMDGGSIEPVDIITFGSPCQDLSIIGKREGLDGNRSGLFYEAVRIIKEMRCATNGKYPRYIVWENVPGAFSSNKGEDFRCILKSICSIANETVSVPSIRKWQSAGSIVGDGYSIAWRVLDAQHWGVPQRRKRVYLVADFAGGCAGKILFESECLSGYTPQGFRAWQGAAGSVEENLGETSCLSIDVYNTSAGDIAPTLCVGCGTSVGVLKGNRARRFTPTECARLQGFPDWWCDDLGTEHPTDAEVDEWHKIFETHRQMVGDSSKPKSDKQIRSFLKDPHSDTAEYKMWGNGIALPNAYFVLSGIVWATSWRNSDARSDNRKEI